MLKAIVFVVNAIIFVSAGYLYGQASAQPLIERKAVIDYVVTQVIFEQNQ